MAADAAMHGGAEDTFADTERALRERIARLEMAIHGIAAVVPSWWQEDEAPKQRVYEKTVAALEAIASSTEEQR